MQCSYCNDRYKEVEGGTTSHLWRHLEGCGAYKRYQGKTSGFITINESDRQGENEVTSKIWMNAKWYLIKDRDFLAKMIIAHELPFMFDEYSLFITYMKYNNPLWQKVSRNNIRKECVKVVESE